MIDNNISNQQPSSEAFRPMRRIRQQLTEEEAIELLRSATSGVLSLIGDGGYPYGVPLSHVYHAGHICFHTALRGHKVDAIRHCDKASFAVIAQDEVHSEEFTTYFRSVICFGRIRIIESEEEKMAATRMLGHRFAKGDEAGLDREIKKSYRAMMMLDFTIEHITGKESIELARKRNHE